MLFMAYSRGEGVAQDVVDAVMWLIGAESLGHPMATKELMEQIKKPCHQLFGNKVNRLRARVGLRITKIVEAAVRPFEHALCVRRYS